MRYKLKIQNFGGRGASLGRYHLHGKNLNYGDEFKTLLHQGNIKFVERKNNTFNSVPRETMTKGRVYVTINKGTNMPSSIIYFDNENKRKKQIDLNHFHNNLKPHVHHGYDHNENDGVKGATGLEKKEKAMIDRVLKIWEDYINK